MFNYYYCYVIEQLAIYVHFVIYLMKWVNYLFPYSFIIVLQLVT